MNSPTSWMFLFLPLLWLNLEAAANGKLTVVGHVHVTLNGNKRLLVFYSSSQLKLPNLFTTKGLFKDLNFSFSRGCPDNLQIHRHI